MAVGLFCKSGSCVQKIRKIPRRVFSRFAQISDVEKFLLVLRPVIGDQFCSVRVGGKMMELRIVELAVVFVELA